MLTRRLVPLACALAAFLGLAAARAGRVDPDPMQTIAERYVKLVLRVGQHDADYVDAYYGPAGWKPPEGAAPRPVPELRDEAHALTTSLDAVPAPSDEMQRLRVDYLKAQLRAVDARLRMLQGERLTFDEESKALYDAVAPTHPDAYFAGMLADLERLLPGTGPLVDRYEAFKRDFVIPPARLQPVFDAAIAECRARTKAHIALPEAERFTLEFVTDKPWSGYNWYKGDATSLIQVNTELPIYIDRAIDLACHEGYPGHHVYNVLLEQHLVKERGWQEFTVYPLFSPQSLIAEGTANFGIEVAFPGHERTRFERKRLYPIAGLDASRADRYAEVAAIVDRLSYAGNEAARRYINGHIDREAAAVWLTQYALMPKPRAEQRVRFFEKYRSYVINYNLGKDLVRAHVEKRGGTGQDPGRRWAEFAKLLSSPRLPSSLER